MNKLFRSICALFLGTVLLAASALSARASSTFITFSVDMSAQITNATFNPASDVVSAQGTFNGWASFLQLVQVGDTSVYTNTVNDTAEPNGGKTIFQYVINSGPYEISADFNLRAARLPANSGDSLILPTPYFDDAGPQVTNNITFQVDVSQQIALGNFSPETNTVEVRGNFNGWAGTVGTLTNVPAILRTNQYGLVTSNVYVGAFPSIASSNAAMDYKFVIAPGSFESPASINTDNSGNRFFTESSDQVLPVVDFSDAPYAPLASVTFSVDMSAVLISDPNFDPTTVTLDGDFNSWAADVPATNNPAAANTNIYSATIISGAGTTINYQFRYLSAGSTVYDNPTGGGNRQFTVPNVASTNVPTEFFNDIKATDLLNVDTTVLFSVNMTNATDTSGNAFNPSSDTVYINGNFIGWLAWNPLALSAYSMTNNPPGSEVYSYTMTFPKGASRSLIYKYSINGTDNEAPVNQNHGHYIRSTNGVYTLALDKFGTQTSEPKSGNLVIGKVAGGVIPLTWLGYPGVHLQSTTSLTGGSWQDIPATDGLSVTNAPVAGSSQFFRLNSN